MAGLVKFEMPKAMVKDEATATDRYAKFVTEPWENGLGHTIGNSLRRVLLTMMEGVAVSCIRIEGISHEFTPIPGVMEDVMEIVLNIKKLKFRCDGSLPRTLTLEASKKGVVTGADIKEDGVATVLNKDQKLFTLTADCKKDKAIKIELDLAEGSAYRPSERNKSEDQPVNSIPVDCLFNPIEKVHYDVRPSRVGENTNYDRLELEVWTDGRVDPEAAVKRAAQILREQLAVFEFGSSEAAKNNGVILSDEESALLAKLTENVKTLGLSMRSMNCLDNEDIRLIGQLVQKTSAQMMKCRNFGNVSLKEITDKLSELGLSLEMSLSKNVIEELNRQMAEQLKNTATEH